MKKIVGLVFLAASSWANAALEESSAAEIVRLISYAEYGSGDVVFALSIPSEQCSTGYWLKKSDPGFNANLSMLIAAYQTKTKVRVNAHTDQLWAGSSNKYCHVYMLEYRQ